MLSNLDSVFFQHTVFHKLIKIGQEDCTNIDSSDHSLILFHLHTFHVNLLVTVLPFNKTWQNTQTQHNKVIMVQHCWQDYDSVNGKILFGNNTGTG